MNVKDLMAEVKKVEFKYEDTEMREMLINQIFDFDMTFETADKILSSREQLIKASFYNDNPNKKRNEDFLKMIKEDLAAEQLKINLRRLRFMFKGAK